MRGFGIGLAVAALAVAAPAWAQQGGTASFGIGGVNYTAPVPAGYCLPASAAEVERMRAIAVADRENMTALSVISCGSAANPLSYFVVKTPYQAVELPVTLRDVLDLPDFNAPEKDAQIDDQEMADVVKRETGMDATVRTDIRLMGHDDVCGYMGGTVSVEIGQERRVSLGGCMTVAGKRMVMVIFTAPGDDPADIARLKAKARAFALTIHVKPD
ncbi:hypothetical protein OF829_02495 [Sphingomonas sp. LB-2]|uniref:hypothetical protein n=1 Tax=Sphingomonas caeni TaxID=2984949 RepID=UPI002231ACB6|nr:hypothetical protein [Sphingomonas caeni]MCW3846090.1 hypothetical protein [Sphingomonas caeni]